MVAEQPWFKHYDQGVPHSLAPYPECTLLDIVAETARERPQHPAMLFQGGTIAYDELARLSDRLAEALIRLEVKPGDRVALVMPNTPQLVLSFLGAWKAGAIVSPLNPLYTESELEHCFHESGAETVIVLTPFYNKVKAIQARTKIRNFIATNVKEFVPPLKRVLFTLLKEKKDGHRIQLQSGDHWLPDLLQKNGDTTGHSVDVKPGDPAILLFSGGTTGTPKAALGTHQGLLMSGIQIRTWFNQVLDDWKDIIMMNMPLFHAYAAAGVFPTVLVSHNPMALVANPRDLNDMLAIIEKVKPAFLPGVPTLYNALLNHPKIKSGKADLTSVKLCFSGASSLLAETKQRFETVTGGCIVEGYGMTESMMGATVSPACGVYKPGSIGIPLPDIEVRIIDLDTGEEELGPGQVGEILLRAPQVMLGYWEKPTETENILRDGWLYTGDIGYQDEDGYVFIVDRKKDLIKPSGFQVWPREVEEVIAAHPAIAEVCVAGIPDAYSVEAVKAWVVLRTDQELSEAELKAFCREKLAGYKVPKQIAFTKSLPKSAVGKILRRELVAREKAAT